VFDTDSDDDDVLATERAGLRVPVTAISHDEDFQELIKKLSALDGFDLSFMNHEALNPQESTGIVLFNIRMMEAFHDLTGLQQGRESYLRDALDQLFEDFMPLEVNVGLLPKRVRTVDNRTLSFTYQPILSAQGSPEKVIVAAMDITEEVAAQAHLESLRAASDSLLRILSEYEAFEEFLAETKRDIELMRNTHEIAVGKRLLHTLKGNASVMGLHEIASLIHSIESTFEDSSSAHSLKAHADVIDKAFEDYLERNKKILGIDWHSSESHVKFSSHDLEKIIAFVRSAQGEGKGEALRVLEDAKLRTVHSMLAGFDEIAHQLGEKFGKSIEFQLIGGDLKLDPEVYGPLLKSLVHALRNACDHGIEDPEERERQGKAVTGVITFKFEPQESGQLRITLSDSGRGIQIERVLAKALQNRIISEDEVRTLRVKDVMHLVFHDGLSTKEAVSETSGRGVGMACIREEVEALGGRIRIASKVHKGTVFELNVPFSQSA
jgi:chemotaxis protein histidine kinase CheA